SRGKYERVRYAFVAFANEEDKRTVLEYEEEEFIKNNKIFWTETETKTCHVCLSTQHLTAACPKIQDRRINENRINKLADLNKRNATLTNPLILTMTLRSLIQPSTVLTKE